MSRLFLLLCIALAASANPAQDESVRSKPVSIIFDTKQIIVNPTESLSLDCGVSGDYRYCHWEKGLTQVLQVQDVHDGYMEGLRKPDNIKGNECGIVINSVTTEDHGQWTCKVFVIGNTLTGTKNVTVTIRPTSPVLEVNNRPLMIDEDTEKTVSCSVAAARPQASIHWFLGDEDISYNSRTENSLTDNMGTYKSMSTLKHEFKAWNNNKPLRCSVTHYTLDLPVEDYVDIRVNYMPWGKDEALYGIRLGDDVEATLDFSSNPSPRQVRWGYGPKFEEIQAVLPVPGKEGRYSTDIIALDEGHFTIILSVLEFAEMDSKMDFKIAVMNDLGEREFKINLSNEKPPNAVISDPISTGILASILVVVFCIITLLCCTCYMKLTHKYCFAKKKPTEEGKAENGTSNSDTESARENGTQKKKGLSLFGKLKKPSSKTEKKGVTNEAAENGNTNEVVYAELSLAPGTTEPAVGGATKDNGPMSDTEYACIVGEIKNGDKKEAQV